MLSAFYWWVIDVYKRQVYGLVTADLNSADPISFYRSVDGMSFEKFFQNFETRADLPLWPLLFLSLIHI